MMRIQRLLASLRGRSRWPYLVAITLGFSAVFFFNAYLCDDAFFSFRVADNFVRGHGFRWNIADRVQTFTSPLHTLVFAALYELTYDPSPVPNPNRIYFTSMFLSYVVSLFGILWMAVRVPPRIFAPFFFLLLSSQAFVSFTSSGLETPWVYLFVILFYQKFLFGEFSSSRDYFWAFLWASLSVVTRLDTALLFLPACGYLLVKGYSAHGVRLLRGTALAGLPIVSWFAFSLIYYGFLLPNSYYAKIGMDVEADVLRQMGAAYLTIGFHEEPITLLTLAAGIIVSAFQLRTRFAGLSVALYTYYVFSIGGDFIGYRFLAAPFLLSALIGLAFVTQRELLKSRLWVAAVCAGLLLYSALTPASPMRAFRDPPAAADVEYYFSASNLALWRPGQSFPFGIYDGVQNAEHCQRLRTRSARFSVSGGGYEAYCRGPAHHVINVASIADPLLARLMVRVDGPFLPGHVFKPIPLGYFESISSGTSVIADPQLARYFEKLQSVITAPLFEPKRWKAIWELNFTPSRRFHHTYLPDHSHRRVHPPSLVERLGW
jgi:arabinofuranosyltransferase